MDPTLGEAKKIGGIESAPVAEVPAMGQFADPRLAELAGKFQDAKVPWPERIQAMEDWVSQRGAVTTPGQPMSRDEFSAQATALGLSLELVTEAVSRFGNRPPQVIAAEGFRPNPNEKPGSLLAHLERRSCSLVSLTEVGTEHVAEALSTARSSAKRTQPDLIGAARELAATWREKLQAAQVAINTDLRANPSPENIQAFLAALQVTKDFADEHRRVLGVGQLQPFEQGFTLYEYKIVGVEGVRPTGITGFPYPHQREITVREVAAEQVVAYREVHVRSGWMLLGDLEIVTAPTAPKERDSQLVGGTKVSFGDWQPMPRAAQ